MKLPTLTHGFLTRSVLVFASFLAATACLAGPPGTCGPEALGVARVVGVDGRERLALGLQSYPRTLDLQDHEVVLTFDDGPARPTARVLDALARECVRATFFLIGRNAAAMPGLVRREIEEGHGVGHHSYSHPGVTLRGLSEAMAEAEIVRGIVAVEMAGYGSASEVPHTPFFRFPGFADTPGLLGFLAGRGVTVFGADLWASDWRKMGADAELALVMARLERLGKGIVLLHDSRGSTAQMLPAFLRELKARGYRVVHVVPGAGPTPVIAAPEGWTSKTEATIAESRVPRASRPLAGRGQSPIGTKISPERGSLRPAFAVVLG